jgi:hypothetical protein
MKYFQLIGGFCGFILAFASSISAGNEVAIALRDGAVGCVCGALMLRGFHAALAWSVRDFALEKTRRNVDAAKALEGQ